MIIYTTIYWWYDTLKEQPTKRHSFHLITDKQPQYETDIAKEQRHIHTKDTHRMLHPRLRAKYYKTHPRDVFNDELVMYVDWSCRFLCDNAIDIILSAMKPDTDILVRKHPERDCIYEEAKASKHHKKYDWLDIDLQVENYRDIYPEHWWLSACGMLLYKKSDKLMNFLEDWRRENLKRTYQDQLSFEPMIMKHWINRQQLEIGTLRDNQLMTFHNQHIYPDK